MKVKTIKLFEMKDKPRNPLSGKGSEIATNDEAKSKRKLNLDFSFKDLAITLLLFVITMGVYELSIYLFSLKGETSYYLMQLFALGLAILILVAVGLGQATKSRFKKVVALCLVLVFSYHMGTHYIQDRIKEHQRYEEMLKERAVKTKTDSIAAIKKTVTNKPDIRNYYPGDKPYFKLGPNQETGWLNIPSNGLTKATFYANGSFWEIPKFGKPIFLKNPGNARLPVGLFKLKAANQSVLIEIDIQ